MGPLWGNIILPLRGYGGNDREVALKGESKGQLLLRLLLDNQLPSGLSLPFGQEHSKEVPTDSETARQRDSEGPIKGIYCGANINVLKAKRICEPSRANKAGDLWSYKKGQKGLFFKAKQYLKSSILFYLT